MSFVSQLIEATDTHCGKLEKIPFMQKMLTGDLSEQEYINFMSDIYPVVLHFCPTMAAAAGRCATQHDSIRNYLYSHIHEEKGHEKIVLQDIESFGRDSQKIIHAPIREPVQAMLSFNYFCVLMENPASVLGMIYVLEIISSVYAGKVAVAASKSFNRPITEGFVFLHSHSSVDMEHMAKLRQLFQTIESPNIFLDLMNSIKMNFYLFENILHNPRAS